MTTNKLYRPGVAELLNALESEIKSAQQYMADRGKGGQTVSFHGDFASAGPSTLQRLSWWLRELRAAHAEEQKWTEDDEPIPEDDAIKAAHPARTGNHAVYTEAMRMVGAKRSKNALVSLVHWLLISQAETRVKTWIEAWVEARREALGEAQTIAEAEWDRAVSQDASTHCEQIVKEIQARRFVTNREPQQ